MWSPWCALAPLWAVLPFIRAEILTPPYFNIASNRKVEASSTCGVGVEGPELYCKLVGTSQDFWDSDNSLIDGQVCDVCDPKREDKYHPPSLAVDGTESYWLSPPLSRGEEYHKVNLTIDLGQEFHVAYVLIKMGISPRPGLWVLEKSTDNGETYTPWQYFAETAADCISHFGKESLEPITRDDSVICTTTYSKILPLDHGEIIVSLLNTRPSANDFFNSSDLQEWTRATHVRLRLIKAQTLYGDLLFLERQDPTVSRRYFYSIKDISIGGRCQCNGHADVCVSKNDNPYKLKCECQHKTCGDNCEKCCENKVQKKWRQSKANMLFECEECNCNGHTDLCVYNATVDELALSMDIHGKFEGGGVCKHCSDNTEGINCEKCKPLFYKPWDKMINQTDACEPCNCTDRRYTGNCAEGSGICECKQNYAGPHCNVCSLGYTDYPNCTPCPCNLNGTLGSICDPVNGTCFCMPNFYGERCDECNAGFYNFPKCELCSCYNGFSVGVTCDPETGTCKCLPGVIGDKCDTCPYRWVFNKTTGCSKCDKCVHDLLDVVDKLPEQLAGNESKFVEIKNFAKQRLLSMNNTIEKVFNHKILDLKNYKVNVNTLNREFEELQGNVDDILKKFTSTMEKINGTMRETLHNANKALKDLERADNVKRKLLDVGETVKGYYGKKAEQDVKEATDILNKLKNFTNELTEDLEKAKNYDERSEKLLENITAHKMAIDKKEHDLIELNNKIKQLNDRLQDLRGHSQNTKKNVEQINEIHKNLRDELSGIADINARILKENNDAEQLLQNTYGILNDTWSLLKQANASSYNFEGEKVKWDELTLEVGNKSNLNLNDLEGVSDLVQQAVNSNALENKTEVLTSVAKQYQQDTNAVEQAYKNIVDTLRGAYITSEEAGNFSEKASNQTTGLGNRTLDSKQLSANLENEAQQVLNIINNVLKTEFLKEEKKFKSVLNLKDQTDKELQGIKNELGNITVAPIDHEILNRAQQNEEEAERLKNRIADIAKDFPLSKELAERLETAEQDSNRNVTEVKKIMAQMDNELKNINSLEENFRITSSNMEKTNQDIKDKLEKLKKKIEKARDSVNSIKVAVSFNHTSLDLRKPKNLEKQGINNYVSLYFKTTEPDGLLFYLGNEKVSKRRARRYVNSEDFMALEIQNGLLKLTVDLGNGPTSIIDDNNVIDGHWYQTIVERTAKTIRLTVRVPNTTLQPTVHVKEGVIKGTSTILNLNRETSKLFIGGFPSTFTPPEEITSKPYLGQMEELFIGGSLLSLWNFEEKSKPSAAKERNELINTTFTTGFRFNGYGYVIMAKNNLDNRFHRMSKASAVTLSFKTFSKDGLLFLSEKGTNFMSIEIREGRILYQFNLGEGLATMFSSETYNDGKWHRVETSRLENDGVLKVDGKFIKKDSALGTNNRMKVPAEFYVGGYPHRNILEVTNANFDGCIDEVSFDDPVDLNKYTAAEGVIAGCPDKVASVVSFEEGAKGYVLQPNISATNDSMELILRFNTAAKTGLLAYAVDDESSMALWLEDGQLIFTNGDDYIKSTLPNKYNDRKWHVVMAVYDSTTFQLFVDDIDTYSSKEPIKKPVRMVHGDLYFGGISSAVDAAAALKSQFSGCISDVTWNGDIINFGNLTEIPRAIVGKCVLLRPIPFPAGLSDEITEEPLGAADPEVAPLISNPKFTEDCKLPLYGTIPLMNENAGYRFGAAFGSRFEYVTLRVNLKNKYRFSIEIKTKANDGVIFFAFNNKNNNFIALYLKDGKINYGFDCGSGDALLFSDRVVNDNKWHTIEFRRQAENGHLRIDNFTVAKGSSRGNLRTLDVDKYFLGGLDPLMRQDPISVMKGINASFEGCLRNFKVNDRDIKNAQSIAVQPCVDTVEDGIYFSPDGGYIEQRTRFKVGVKFRVEFNIKPRSLSGLLLSIHGRKDYLVLELVNGTVRMTVENGDGEITSTYIPPDRSLLCDGHWHTIKAIKSKHVITLAVDNDFKDPVQGKRFPSVDTQHTLYLGGHPNPKRLPGVLSPFSYVGCLKNLVINGVIEPIYIRNTVGSVTINACPTN